MLLKFFINSNSTAHLRGLADEFGESTNAIRHELNNLSKASYLIAEESGRTIQYRANTVHPLYPDIKNIVHKYVGFDKIVANILSKLGKLYLSFIVGDYAKGKDTGLIELVLVGEIDLEYLKRYVKKVEKLISRKIHTEVITLKVFQERKYDLQDDSILVIWTEK